MTTFTINGESYNIAINLSTMSSFEEITGKPFSTLFNEEDTNTKTNTCLIMASLIANNEDKDFNPTALLNSLSLPEYKSLMNIITRELASWLAVPAIAEQHVPEQPSSDATEEDNHPNS